MNGVYFLDLKSKTFEKIKAFKKLIESAIIELIKKL